MDARRKRTLHWDYIVTRPDGTFDLQAMQEHYRQAVRDEGRFQARELLTLQVREAVPMMLPDESPDSCLVQARFAINAVLARCGHPTASLHEIQHCGQ